MADSGTKYCPNGHPMDPSWNVCPYCSENVSNPQSNEALKKTVREAAPGVPVGMEPKRKTMRLEEEERSPVVGWLVDIDGKQKGQDFRLRGRQTLIGASSECDILIENDFASDRHASIRFEKGEYVLTDLDTTNGTTLNGKPVAREILKDGDTIKIGKTTYIFKGLFIKNEER